MVDIAWAIVRSDDRYLLAQHSIKDANASGMWSFPDVKLDSLETPSGAASRELRRETGLVASNLTELFETQLNDCNIHVLECHNWSGNPYPACDDIMGIGWFTIPEMWNLDSSLSPVLAKILPQLTFSVRHNHRYSDSRRTDMRDE